MDIRYISVALCGFDVDNLIGVPPVLLFAPVTITYTDHSEK